MCSSNDLFSWVIYEIIVSHFGFILLSISYILLPRLCSSGRSSNPARIKSENNLALFVKPISKFI